MKATADAALHTPYGLAGIFDNVRDGLVLVRFPEREIVLFNRAASEMSGIPSSRVVGQRVDRLFADRSVLATIRRCSESPVGVWPGHFQEVQQTKFRGPRHDEDGVELHFCRVDPDDLAGPLVLLVMRPFSEVELENVVRHYARYAATKVGGKRKRPARRTRARTAANAKR